jgi:hypothetical protein
MRKTYGPEYPHTLGVLMEWSGLDPEAPPVTDAAGTLEQHAIQTACCTRPQGCAEAAA